VRIGRRVLPAGKISLLIVLLLVGLVVAGCTGIRGSPEGGSGATMTDETIFLSPSVKQAGGFGCSSPAVDGKLVAVNAETGVQRWEVTLGGAVQSGGFGCSSGGVPVAVYGSPTLSGELVYVAGYNGKVYALNAESGALRWVYPREGNMDSIVSGLVVALDKLFFGCADGNVYALDAATGDIIWEFATGDKIWSTPAFDGETLYVSSFDKKLYAINANDGTEKWRFQAEKWFWTRAVAFEDSIYVGCFDGKAYGFNALNGEKIAEFDLESPVRSWPVLVEDRVLIATEAGKIYTIDAVNNQLGLFADLAETIYAPLGLNEGVLYVYTQEQNLHALNADTGVRLWFQPFK
jgi:outer membrane protein assembly factor BamB